MAAATTTYGVREELEQAVAAAEERLKALQDELRALPEREGEADQLDKQAASKAHAAWVEGGQQGPRPVNDSARLRAVHRRLKALETEIPVATAELNEARMYLLAHRAAGVEKAVESDRRELARLDAQLDQLKAERDEVAGRISHAIDGQKRQLEIARWKCANEATAIRSRLAKR